MLVLKIPDWDQILIRFQHDEFEFGMYLSCQSAKQLYRLMHNICFNPEYPYHEHIFLTRIAGIKVYLERTLVRELQSKLKEAGVRGCEPLSQKFEEQPLFEVPACVLEIKEERPGLVFGWITSDFRCSLGVPKEWVYRKLAIAEEEELVEISTGITVYVDPRTILENSSLYPMI